MMTIFINKIISSNKMEQIALFQLGLNKNEAKVYLTLLQLGSASAGELIKKTEFHRNIVYDNLEKLIDKGLVTFIQEGKKKIFHTSPPEMISEMIVKEQEKLDLKKKVAEEVMKEVLKSKLQEKNVQEATIYRGVKGLKVLLNDTIKEGKDYFVIGAPKSSVDIMGETFWKNYNLKRSEQKTIIKMLFNEDLRSWSKVIKSKLTQIRFLPKRFDGLTETMIYSDKVALVVWGEKPIATLIQDKHLAENYKKYFHFLWEQAKE